MKKTIILSLLAVVFSLAVSAQSIWTLSYEPATPIGDLQDFTGKTSLRGLSGSANWYIGKKITVGFTLQWTGFYEKVERGTWDFEGGAITATAWKEFYIFPLYVNAKYHFLEEGRVIPFAGLSVGTAYTEQSLQVGTYEYDEKSWKFSLAPEAGIRIPMGMEKQWGFNVMARYQMNFYDKNNINLLQYINYSVGVYWKLFPRGERY